MAISDRNSEMEVLFGKKNKEMPSGGVGGFIIICSQERMPKDIEFYLLGLFCTTQEHGGCEIPGCPYFLYNYSTQCLYGAFAALDDEDGLSLDTYAWERKDPCKTEWQHARRTPPHVGVHVQKLGCPLEEGDFTFIPFPDTSTRLRIELSKSEVVQILKIFGVSSSNRTEIQDVSNGDWEKVKSKRKAKREVNSVFLRRDSSPSRLSARRRGTHLSNGHCCLENGSVLHERDSPQIALHRTRNRESKAQFAKNWGRDLCRRNQSCETSILSLNLTPCEDERHHQVGSDLEILHEKCSDLKSQKYGPSNDIVDKIFKNVMEVDMSNSSPFKSSSVNCDGGFEAMQNPLGKSSFESYSAALKAGMCNNNGSCDISPRMSGAVKKKNNFTCTNGVAVSNGTVTREENNKLISFSDTSDQQGKQPWLVHISRDGYMKSVSMDSHSKRELPVKQHDTVRRHSKDMELVNAKTTCDVNISQEMKKQGGSILQIPKHSELQDLEVFSTKASKITTNTCRETVLPSAGRFHDPDPAVGSDHSFLAILSEQNLSCNQLDPSHEDDEHDIGLNNGTLLQGSLFSHPSTSEARKMARPAGQIHWGVQSPLLLYMPILSPTVSTLPSLQPSSPPIESGRSYSELLHFEILEFVKKVRPTAIVRARVEDVVRLVSNAVIQLWPGAEVEVFGSFSTGLCLTHSDVDLAVTVPSSLYADPCSMSGRLHIHAPLIRELASYFHQYSWCESLCTIDTASIPVIKLQCRPPVAHAENETSIPLPVAVDITIGRKKSVANINFTSSEKTYPTSRMAHNGAAARDYIVSKLLLLPALAPLALLIKSYLHHRQLNDVYSGGLGSFSLTLLLVFYLEQVPSSCSSVENLSGGGGHSHVPALYKASTAFDTITATDEKIAPSSVSAENSYEGCNLSKVRHMLDRADHVVTEVLMSMESLVTPNLGALLLGFLHTFGHTIDLSCVRLVLKGVEGSVSGILPREPASSPVALCIDDPLNPGSNVGAGSFNMWFVQAALKDMFHVLTRPHCNGSDRRLLDELFMMNSESQELNAF